MQYVTEVPIKGNLAIAFEFCVAPMIRCLGTIALTLMILGIVNGTQLENDDFRLLTSEDSCEGQRNDTSSMAQSLAFPEEEPFPRINPQFYKSDRDFEAFLNNDIIGRPLRLHIRNALHGKVKEYEKNEDGIYEIAALHFYCLINRHDSYPIEPIIYKLAEKLCSITSLNTFGTVNLSGVVFDSSPVKVLKIFNDHYNTTTLNVSETNIDLAELNAHNFYRIRCLHLDNNNLTEVPCLDNFTGLVNLYLCNNRIKRIAPEKRSTCTELYLFDNPNLDIVSGRTLREAFPKLRRVHLDNSSMKKISDRLNRELLQLGISLVSSPIPIKKPAH